MVRYSFLVRLFHPLLHAGLIPALSLINFRVLSVVHLIFDRMMSSTTVIVFVRRDRVFRIKPSSARGVQSP
jgi:hypothetical protein